MQKISLSFITAFVFSTSAVFAGTALEKLQAEAAAGSVFVQMASNRNCPDEVRLNLDIVKLDWMLPTDIAINLAGNATLPGGRDSFVPGGGAFFLRPGLEEGQTHAINRHFVLPAGVSYSVRTQKEKDGIVTSEYKAKVATIYMITLPHYRISYNANLDQISYLYEDLASYLSKEAGVDPVHCVFKKK